MLNRGSQVVATVVFSLVGFGLIQVGLTSSPSFAQTFDAKPLAAPNTAPKISAIPDQATNEDNALGPITFYVSDVETAATALTVTTSFSNAVLIGTISQTNNGATRALIITPTANAFGSSLVTVTVSDGISTTDEIFTLTVISVNDAPTISAIADLTLTEDSTATAIPFTVGDVESATASLQVTATTSNASLLPLSNIVFGGSDASRTVTLTPAANASGLALITIMVSDGLSTTNKVFTLTVTAVNDAPTISAIPDQSVVEDSATPAIPFTVGDVESPTTSLIVTATTNMPAVIPLSGIVFGGSGANRTVTLTPLPNASDALVLITVVVSDGITNTSQPFSIYITPTNDAPAISNITDKATNEDTPTSPILFDVTDVETPADSLIYTLNSAPSGLIGSYSFSGSGPSRSLVITPTFNANGSSVVTVTVSDGSSTASDSFVLTVNAMNDAPTFLDVNDVTTNEDSSPSFIFTITDVDTAIGNVIVTADNSNNPALVSSVTVNGNTATRTVNIALLPNASGTAKITLIASDGAGGFATKQFTLTVNPVNDPPTITPIGNQSTPEDTALGPLNFTVNDIDGGNLTMTASSSAPSVVANANLVVSPVTGGNGGRSLTISPMPNANGTTQITVLVSDGQATTQTTFILNVTAVNDAPTIDPISSQTTAEDTPKNVTVTFNDVDDTALTPSAVAGNATLVPNAAMIFSGSGNTRILTITPAPNINGSTLITVTVVDPAGAATVTSFLLTVTPVNDAPTVGTLTQQNGLEDTLFSYSPIVVNDSDTPVDNIVLTATSSNQGLVLNSSISFSGSGANRTIALTPQPNQSGLVVITIYASDGQANSTQIFNVQINPVNDAPTISAIANASTNEDTPTGQIVFTVGDIDDGPAGLSIVSASSNPTLVPASNVVPGGSGANRYVTITPAPNQNGTVVIAVTVRDAGGLSATSNVTLIVNPINDAPTISEIATQFVQESGSSGTIPVTIGDLETAGSGLQVTASSSNQSLILNSGLAVSTNGTNRTLTITPVQYQNGSATVTLIVRDPEGLSALIQFVVNVAEVNDPPTITPLNDVHIAEDGTLGPVAFQINDVDTPVNALGVTATTDTPSVIPLGGIVIEGNGTNKTLLITPLLDKNGYSTINMLVSDGSNTTRMSFNLYVDAVNDAPKITPINAISMTEDTNATTNFVVSDVDNDPLDLKVSASSSNPSLVPVANILFGGNAANRTVTIVPALNQYGTTTVTVTVSDGSLTDSTTFVVTVNAVNDAPTITAIADQVTNEDVTATPVAFTVNDVESPASNLQITATSSNPALVPLSGIAFSGTGSEHLVTLTPLPNQNGSTTITLIVTDEEGASVSRSFFLVVNAVNDAPVISTIKGKTILQSTFVTIAVALSDIDNLSNQLQLTGDIASSNPNLIPNTPSNFYFTGNTLSRLLTIVPTPGEIGSAIVTVTVSDGALISYTVFPVVVTPFNNPPTISAVPNQVINEDAALGPVEFNVNDVELPPGDLEVLGVASNGTLIPTSQILINSYGGLTRTLMITPSKDQWGSATITLSVNDGLSSDSKVFNLTVNSVDDPPTVSAVQTKTNSSLLVAGVASKPMTFTVGDPDTPLANLQVTILSSNANIVAPSDVSFNGTGITRTLVVKPKPGKAGKVTLTVRVSDGTTAALTSFDLVIGVRLNLALLFKNFASCDPLQTDCSEPNNLLTTAYGPININTIYTGTVNGTNDRYDHYTITLEAEVSYTFKLDFPVGDLDLYLYGSAFATTPLASSAKSSRPEQFEYRPRVTAVYYILAYGYESGNATNRRYTLQVKPTSGRTKQAEEFSRAVESVGLVSSELPPFARQLAFVP